MIAATRAAALFVSALLVGCGSLENWLETPERELGTHGELDRRFHRVVRDPEGPGFRFPCVLIGIEKTDREILDVPELARDPWIVDAPGELGSAALAHDVRAIEALRATLEDVLDDPKRTFVSHAVDYRWVDGPPPRIRADFLYDAYGADPRRGSEPRWPRSAQLYADSWTTIERLRAHLADRISGAAVPYTHLMLGAMGWNTPQEEAIANLNSLFGNLMAAAEEHGDARFHPLIVVLTWPSEWRAPTVSYANKAGDADELGLVWANALLNGVLCPLRDALSSAERPLHVVALGHSFGARIVTRAAFSGSVLERSPRALPDGADLVVGLQGAFSANRFLAEREEGREGHPYHRYRDLRGRIALTWSEHDEANPLANWISGANHVGGRLGYERACDPRYRHHFDFRTAELDGSLELAEVGASRRVLMIDASEIVRYEVTGTGGGAHSDVYHRDMGRLVWDLIARLTPVGGAADAGTR